MDLKEFDYYFFYDDGRTNNVHYLFHITWFHNKWQFKWRKNERDTISAFVTRVKTKVEDARLEDLQQEEGKN